MNGKNNTLLSASELICLLIHQLKIYFVAKDLQSRCQKCNCRDFRYFPRHLLRLLFNVYVKKHHFDWIKEDREALKNAKRYSSNNNQDYLIPNNVLSKECYTLLLLSDNEIFAMCQDFSIDIK